MNEERTGKCLQQVEHIRGHLTQIFHNGQPSHGGDRKFYKCLVEVMTSTLPKGTLGSVASLLAATFYQRNPDRKHKLWNIVSSERYILHMQVLLECCYTYKWKVHNRKIEIIPHCRFRGVGQLK